MTIEIKKPSAIFWGLAVLFLAWNLFGCAIYLLDQTLSDEVYTDRYGETLAAMRDTVPAWATSGYAIAVWSGLLAALAFLLRRRVSLWLFTVSLIGAAVGFIPTVVNADLIAPVLPTFWIMPVFVLVFGTVEILVVKHFSKQGLLR